MRSFGSVLTKHIWVALLVASHLTTGCATLMASGPDQVPISTNPPGAYVYLNGAIVGQTPTFVMLDRDAPAQLQIYLPGFQPLVVTRSKTFNGWFVGSIVLFAAIVPLIVDLATGDFQRYDDEPIAIGLTPMAGPPPQWYQPPNQGPPPVYHQPPHQPPQQPPHPPPFQPPPSAQVPIVPPPGR